MLNPPEYRWKWDEVTLLWNLKLVGVIQWSLYGKSRINIRSKGIFAVVFALPSDLVFDQAGEAIAFLNLQLSTGQARNSVDTQKGNYIWSQIIMVTKTIKLTRHWYLRLEWAFGSGMWFQIDPRDFWSWTLFLQSSGGPGAYSAWLSRLGATDPTSPGGRYYCDGRGW